MKHFVRVGIGAVLSTLVVGLVGEALHVEDLPLGLGEVVVITTAVLLTTLFDRELFWDIPDD